METQGSRLGSLLVVLLVACSSNDDLKRQAAWSESCDPAGIGAAGSGGARRPTRQPTTTGRSNTGGLPSDDDLSDPRDEDEPIDSDLESDEVDEPATSVAGIDCPDPSELTPNLTVHGDVRNIDAVWEGIVHIDGDVEVFDASITIEPGTVIMVDKSVSIVMGGPLGEVLLTAAGTPTQPIRFCGSEPGPGFWGGVGLGRMDPSSVLDNVLFDGAGGGDSKRALGVNGEILITSLRITNSGSDGLHAGLFAEGSEDFLIEGSAGYPVAFTGAAAITRFPVEASFVDNQNELARVAFEKIGDEELTYHDIGIPYLQEGDFYIESYGGAKLKFEAGVEYRVSKGRAMSFSANPNSTSEVQILGTANAPVVFAGSESGKGHWVSLRIAQQAPTSKISHLIVSDAGSDMRGAFILQSPIELQDVTVENCASSPAFHVAPAEGSKNFTSTGNDLGLWVLPEGISHLPTGVKIEGNEVNMIEVGPGNVTAGTIQNVGAPYHVASLTIRGDVEIEPGAEFVFAPDGKLTVSPGPFHAIGTSGKRIVFRGEKETRGSWKGLQINAEAAAASELSYVDVISAGLILNGPTSVTRSNFSGSATFGITKRADDMSSYASTNTFTNNAMGDISM